ncbi:hypothetical protein [Actinomadura verrucosospora]|uniref:Uncharacterized protein n=1 Tax=Actinomadura verrucosospora TaxID=46165 RepID=A0A7D3ZNT8_ACTVE|nr:hypothetical protein [Actinomadura verrucosospora]QKG23543.1 hypothetical protein ACTIVE_5186 [Actinomadura verrucosospora]
MFAAASPSGHLTLAAPSAAGPDVFAAFPFLVFGIVALAVVGIVWGVVQNGRRIKALHAHAAACGWWPITPDQPMPVPVAEAARSRRTKLAVATTREHPMWLVWHRWTESSGTGDNRTTSTRDLTRYFLFLGPGYEDVEVVKRTAIGGFFMPVRGVGTGDADFDKRFLIRGPGEHQAVRLLTPSIRAAMLSGHAPAWAVSAGVLISADSVAPSVESLEPRAQALIVLARMLASGG